MVLVGLCLCGFYQLYLCATFVAEQNQQENKHGGVGKTTIQMYSIATLGWPVWIFRLDALALSVIATATWLAGWVAGCHTPVLYQNG